MTSQTLYRLSGGVLMIGSLFAIAGFLLHPGGNNPANYLSPMWFPANLLILVGALLVTLGLPGMYARQAERAGKLGLIGFTLTFFVGLLFNVASGAIETFMFPTLAANVATRLLLAGHPPATYGRLILVALLLELVGPILLGIATLRAKVFPSWTGWLLIATPVLVLVGFFVSLPGPLAQLDAVVLYLALMGMGFSLLARREITQVQPAVSPASS
ncbi:MAG TPA: hypothetical protein VIY29_23785 [Ktedonobacteraceae bacterium]